MPKNLHLFGAHLQNVSRKIQDQFHPMQITRPLPPKAHASVPTASSQMALFGDDDIKRRTKTQPHCKFVLKKVTPSVYKKDFYSEALNTTIFNLRVSSSAMYSMDDAGGFDNYILRTSPEELRSATGEKMREVMYFYMKNPEAKSWGLPWKVFLRQKDRRDPAYARYVHEAKKEASGRSIAKQHARFSPYYLPTKALMHPARQEFIEGSVQPKLNLWWRETEALEPAFRRRLTEAKSFERAHPDHREPMGYKLGQTMGGGGKNNVSVHKRSKTHRFRFMRPY